ncbi:hypothetical protein FIBSPDRAFT_1037927 [Athelia psychrophila]|uniref:Uncharacterized protein n=1 Tax=Athelia psychrophila TaxID=1759441 RepID=A0A166TXE7_9AGAM|nr:hypothetical protein FIBSPDRAFT_969875 [Fibularhizoctonia sp. CBS 109695]KZP31090.1 hypothetical protein FIBSPDRAFT_1037927 [Fibularhizoctonia sp. CBS 109695]
MPTLRPPSFCSSPSINHRTCWERRAFLNVVTVVRIVPLQDGYVVDAIMVKRFCVGQDRIFRLYRASITKHVVVTTCSCLLPGTIIKDFKDFSSFCCSISHLSQRSIPALNNLREVHFAHFLSLDPGSRSLDDGLKASGTRYAMAAVVFCAKIRRHNIYYWLGASRDQGECSILKSL